jgi:mono/diheme cytochrome c family protein
MKAPTIAVTLAVLGLALSCASAGAQGPQFPPEQVARGAQLFALNCATCHGTRMRNPQWAIDLHTFPRDAKARFVDSVMNGKRNMPPWDDVLKPDDLDALWAYVSTGDPGD